MPRFRLNVTAACGVVFSLAFAVAALRLDGLACEAENEAKFALYRFDAANDLVGRARDMDTALMAYLLSGPAGGGENHLIACRAASADIDPLAGELVKVADCANDPDRAAHARKVAGIARARRDDCAFVLGECDAGRKLYAAGHVRDGEGRRKAEWLAAEANHLRDGEAHRRFDAIARANTRRTGLYSLCLVWALVALLLFGSLFWPDPPTEPGSPDGPPNWTPSPWPHHDATEPPATGPEDDTVRVAPEFDRNSL